MAHVAWLTDIHLDLLKPIERNGFYYDAVESDPEAVLLGGDISESRSLLERLTEMNRVWACPIYFVLGNHDYFYGSIREVRAEVDALVAKHPQLVYLTHSEAIELNPRTALIGHDGWADGRLGDFVRSLVSMLDYSLIAEFAGLNKERRWKLMQALADDAADETRPKLEAALHRYEHIYLLTHIPPFREACWHEGRISGDEWLPHFTSKAMGEMLRIVMQEHRDRRLTVLCGHTHGAGEAQILDNLRVVTGGATYGFPSVQQLIEI
ncbi:MAG: metallophosphoesterase family protein [Pirellulales bacterium]|nr:metallophosphoesterase family protein [Pirellulales bacterium]